MKRTLLVLLLLAGFFGLALGSAVLTVNLASRGEEVSTPDLTGQGIVEAIEKLEEAGLNLKINGKEFDDTHPAGTIISHHPAPGALVRRGRSIEAVISDGPRRVAVPDVRGDSLQRAQSILLENNLAIGHVARIPAAGAARDTVIAHTPPGGAAAGKSTAVDLLVADGPRPVTWVMPDLIGRPLTEAVRLAQEAGLEISQAVPRDYPGVPPGAVIGQKPAPGGPVGQSTALDLTVARGRGYETIRGRFALLAFNVPEGSGLRRVRVVVETERGSGEIFEQDRPAGGRVQLLVEVDGRTRALIFIDDSLQETKYF